MFSEAKVTEIYFMTDDFCKEFAKVQEEYIREFGIKLKQSQSF